MNMTRALGLGIGAATIGYYGYDPLLKNLAIKEVRNKKLDLHVNAHGKIYLFSSGTILASLSYTPTEFQRNHIFHRHKAPRTIHYLERCLRNPKQDKVDQCTAPLMFCIFTYIRRNFNDID